MFVSYKSERRKAAEHVATVLRHHGFATWFDYKLIVGLSFRTQLDEKVHAAGAVVVLWCSRSVTSEWVQLEARIARKQGTLVPVLIEDCVLPEEFAELHCVNIKEWDGNPRGSKHIDALLDAIEAKLSRKRNENHDALRDLQTHWEFYGKQSLRRFALEDSLEGIAQDRSRVRQWLSIVAISALLSLAGLFAINSQFLKLIVLGSVDLTETMTGTQCSGQVVEIIGSGKQCLTPDDEKRREFSDCANSAEARVCGPSMVAIPHPANESSAPTGSPSRLLGFSKFEATFGEWDACVADGGCLHRPSAAPWERGKQPVINVSWHQVTTEYLPWLNNKLGLFGSLAYRLPTPEEWQFAARARRNTKYPTDGLTALHANFDATNLPGSTSAQRPLPIGNFGDRQKHPWGLQDLAGNVAEWMAGCWATPTDIAPTKPGVVAVCLREYRGGSWRDRASKLAISELTRTTGEGSDAIGFRLVRDLQ